MGNYLLKNDCITFRKNKIAIGSTIAAFFFKQGTSEVLLEFNPKDNSLIIEAFTPEKRNSCKYKIINPLSISSVQPYKRENNMRWIFAIETTSHKRIVDMSLRQLTFKVKPISKDKLIVENLPLVPFFYVEYSKIIFDMKDSKIICQSSKEVKHNPFNGHQVSNSNRWVAKLSKNKSNLIQNEAKVSQPKIADSSKGTVNKEIGNIWGFKTPPEKLPTSELRIEADKANKKLILGE